MGLLAKAQEILFLAEIAEYMKVLEDSYFAEIEVPETFQGLEWRYAEGLH